MSAGDKKFMRPIRSYVRREGKITSGQQNAIDQLWPKYGVDAETQQLDLAQMFGREAFTVVEIGFGNGLSLVEMAQQQPEQNFLGIEVHKPGVGSLLVQVKKHGLENIRVSQSDAVEVFETQIADECLDRIQIFFPDPWHKKRHHKRRLIQPDFVSLMVKKLKPGGVLHVATDWENYAEHILQVLTKNVNLLNTATNYAKKPEYRSKTKYESRGENLGHGVWDLLFVRR
ncbi:MAG: tRNA (guanosine(46)-N7)-methyltransferase TrmB [Arenicella sp.]|nr:tRNA (guanosine(46)-N7)-methyltransferase TrmB [Arenicella sp.]